MLGQQYESSIAEMMQQQNIKLDATQMKESEELRQKLRQELELLTAYQSQVKIHTQQMHQRERKQLEEKVSLRKALLEQKMEQENVRFMSEREKSKRQLDERQKQALCDFDVETAAMGLDALAIASATEHTSLEDEDDSDTTSIRGSMLSLTPSSSSNSFHHTNTQL